MGELIPIRTSREARILALGPRLLERAAIRGELHRLRPGAYVERGALAGISPASLHLARIAATRGASRDEPVFSHESAAALHSIPIIGEWPDRVQTCVGPTGTHSNRVVARSKSTLRADETVRLDGGASATSLARTAIDLAARRSLLGGIVAISDVRARGVSAEELAALIDRRGTFPGRRRAMIALARSTDRSESVLETLVWVRCQDFRFPTPEQQHPVQGIDGRPYRVDFAWSSGRILLDVDGMSKYDAIARAEGRSALEVLHAEKRREDAIRPVCERFLRADWSDAWGGDGLARRLRSVGIPQGSRRAAVLTF